MSKTLESNEPVPMADPVPLNHSALLGLHDDCIIPILCHLPTDDLASVGNTCTRLFKIVRRIFIKTVQPYPIDYTINMVFGVVYREYFPDSDRRQNTMEKFVAWSQHSRMKRTLMTYGPLMKEIKVNFAGAGEGWDDETCRNEVVNELLLGRPPFGDILEHCGNTLERLVIQNITWTPEFVKQARPLLNRLTKFHSFYGTDTALILSELQQCRDLSITKERCMAVLDRDWPQLERFAFVAIHWDEVNRLHRFLRRQLDIRALHLKVPTSFAVSAIANMHQLEELYIFGRISLVDVQELRFSHLKKLTLRDAGMEILLLLQLLADSDAVTSLVDLHIKEASLTTIAMADISRFSQIERIHLEDIHTTAAPAIFHISNLQHLKEFHLKQTGYRSCYLSALPSLRTLSLERMAIDDNLINAKTRYGSFYLSALPSLRTLLLQRIAIDGNLINAIAQMPQLRCLKLRYVTWKTNTLLKSLHSVQRLEELEIDGHPNNDDMIMAELFNSLGATTSLRSLTILHCRIDDDTIQSFDRFRNLKRIKFVYCSLGKITRPLDFQHSWAIEQLHLYKNEDKFDQFLLNSESVHTLTKLQFCADFFNYETLLNISRFRNLRELDLDNCADIPITDWQRLNGLDQLRKLSLTNSRGHGRIDPFDWRFVFDLVDRLKSLDTVVVKNHFSYNPDHVDRLVNELELVRQQQKCRVSIGMDITRSAMPFVAITFGFSR